MTSVMCFSCFTLLLLMLALIFSSSAYAFIPSNPNSIRIVSHSQDIERMGRRTPSSSILRDRKSNIQLFPLPSIHKNNHEEDHRSAETARSSTTQSIWTQNSSILTSYYLQQQELLKIHKLRQRLTDSKRNNFFASQDFQIRHIHLALTQQPNEMVVQFHTFSYHPSLGRPLVKIGKSRDLKANVEVFHVGAVMTGYGDTNHTGFDYSILMSPLEFDTTYHYQVGLGFVVNGEATFMVKSEQVYNFTTRSEDPDEISVLMFADMGVVFSPMNVKRIQNRVRQEAMNGNFFIYHIGDISYADFYPGMMYQFIWNLWFEYFDEIHPYVPYMVSVGNHEYEPRHPDNQDYEQNFAAYNHKFWMPLRNNSQYGHNMWYHFDFGPVRFVSIDTETNYPHPHESPYPPIFNGDQFSYVTNAIKSTNRSQTPFLVVLGHRPIYSAVKGFCDANGNVLSRSKVLQNVWERVFYEGHVDLYTCGHVHAYERQYPVYNQTVETKSNPNNLTNPRDTVHLIVGTGGCIEGLELNEWYNKNIYWNYKIFNDDEGYALLRVKRDNKNRRQVTITWEFYSTTHDELVDSFVMTKTY